MCSLSTNSLCRRESNRVKGLPFRPVKAIPVDLFPHTNHCELVLLFERLKSDVVATPPARKLSREETRVDESPSGKPSREGTKVDVEAMSPDEKSSKEGINAELGTALSDERVGSKETGEEMLMESSSETSTLSIQPECETLSDACSADSDSSRVIS